MHTTHILRPMAIIAMSASLLSCAAPKFLPPPPSTRTITQSTFTFGVNNIDHQAQVEPAAMTCHYDGFSLQYKVNPDLSPTFVLVNNTDRTLIIDRSKTYILYDGYSTPLFKEARSTRSTTFGNVPDAINNVTTADGSVTLTIPPYSKWALPIEETNVRSIHRLPNPNYPEGHHQINAYDDQETVEFVLPYTYDSTLAHWQTARNRLLVTTVDVATHPFNNSHSDQSPNWVAPNKYRLSQISTATIDLAEAQRIDAINRAKYRRHNLQVHLVGIPLLPVYGIGLWYLIVGCYNPDHEPPVYTPTATDEVGE